MKLRAVLAFVGLAAAIVAVAIAGTAFAQTPTPDSSHQAKANYQQFFLDRLATLLGTTTDKLKSSLAQARNETIDQQVKEGRLTQQQADKMKAQQGRVPFGDVPRIDKRGMGFKVFVAGPKPLDAIAQALGMTQQELADQLRSGKSLADLAAGKEQAVKDAIVAAVKARLDEAVKNGRITQEQADQMLDKMRNSDLSGLGGFGGKDRFKNGRVPKQQPSSKPSVRPAFPRAGTL